MKKGKLAGNADPGRHFIHSLYCLFDLLFVAAEASPQSPSPLELIQQLRQKLAGQLPSSLHKGRLDEGCLLLQAAAAHGTEHLLPAAKHRTTEADLASQVSFHTVHHSQLNI